MARKMLYALIAMVAAVLTPLGLALPASASGGPAGLPTVHLYGAKGGTAAWNGLGQIVLANNSGASYMDVNGVLGTAAPKTAPSYTTSYQGAGNPRWVIEFHNGNYLFGYSSSTTAPATVDTWVCEPGGTPTSDYATALAACQPGYDDFVTAAFIVLDAGNPNSTATLTSVTYNGYQLVAYATYTSHHVTKYVNAGGQPRAWVKPHMRGYSPPLYYANKWFTGQGYPRHWFHP